MAEIQNSVSPVEKTMKPRKESVYIVPYQDLGIGDKINLRVVFLAWSVFFLLKIICRDEEWGLFLMSSYLLLLFIIPFFITKEVDNEDESTTEIVVAKFPSSSSTESSSEELGDLEDSLFP